MNYNMMNFISYFHRFHARSFFYAFSRFDLLEVGDNCHQRFLLCYLYESKGFHVCHLKIYGLFKSNHLQALANFYTFIEIEIEIGIDMKSTLIFYLETLEKFLRKRQLKRNL